MVRGRVLLERLVGNEAGPGGPYVVNGSLGWRHGITGSPPFYPSRFLR